MGMDVKQTCKLDKHIEEVMKKRKEEIVLDLENTLFGEESENAEQSIAQRIFPYLFYTDCYTKEDFDRFYELISAQEYLKRHPEVDYRDGKALNIYDFEMSKDLKRVETQLEGVSSEIFIDDEGTILYFDDDGVLHYGEMELRGEEEYQPSILEDAENTIAERQEHYERMKALNAPDNIIKHSQLLIQESERRLANIQGEIQESKSRRMEQHKDKDDDNER